MRERLTSNRLSTAQKLLKACKVLQIPVYATTQNAARLGSTCSELSEYIPLAFDKTAFSMMVPGLRSALLQSNPQPYQIAIVGIETHICVTQTALDLLTEGHRVYIIADGVSSCNEGERNIALERLRAEGAIVTTSEGWLYECMGDASIHEYALWPSRCPPVLTLSIRFKAIAGLVKDTKDATKDAVQTLCKM